MKIIITDPLLKFDFSKIRGFKKKGAIHEFKPALERLLIIPAG